MLSFIKTEVNVSREVGMLDESLEGNQKDIYNNLLLGERIIALFSNIRTLKFKTKLTITFIVTVIQKQKQANGSKSANQRSVTC